MKTRAAVAVAAGKPVEVTEVDLEGPRDGEVLVEIKATGICHTDDFTLSGADPEGLFPAILGHEGAGVVVDVGQGVTSVRKGDHVIPLYTPECRQCPSCLSRKTNLCTAIRATQGKGMMPDGTSRFSYKGRHYQLTDCPALPRPVQRPHPPIIMGGMGLRRTPELAATYANEFNIAFKPREQASKQLERVRDDCTKAGRDPSSVIFSGPHGGSQTQLIRKSCTSPSSATLV